MTKKFFDLGYISLFSCFSITILSYTVILPASQFQTQILVKSKTRSHIEYFKQTYNIFMPILYSKLMKNTASLAVFNTM